jgi:hypothetical protein
VGGWRGMGGDGGRCDGGGMGSGGGVGGQEVEGANVGLRLGPWDALMGDGRVMEASAAPTT